MEGILGRLSEKYRELEEQCYRASVSQQRRAGRWRKRPQPATVSPELMKKVDLDRALAILFHHFFPEG